MWHMAGNFPYAWCEYLSGLSGIWSAIYWNLVWYMPDAWCEYLSAS